MGKPGSYFTIYDLAKELDVKKSHIRFCEENGLISPRITKLKRRVYNTYDRERLKLIFHFVLLGYAKEQVADLIGMPDANLDEGGQLIQGIEYGEKKLEALVKRKEKLSFTKQTSIINEIEMVREYLKKIKNIKSDVVEKPESKPDIKFEQSAETSTEPAKVITAEIGRKPTQQTVRNISLFVVGFALVIIIGGYFYYQFGQKETQTLKPLDKEQTRSERYSVYQEPVPPGQTVKTQVLAPKTQEIPEALSSVQQGNLNAESTGSAPVVIERKEAIQTESNAGLLKLEKPMAKQHDAGKEDTVSGAVPEAVKDKVPDDEVKAPSTESTENTGDQENLLGRLKSFVSFYCQTYTNKDLDKFITFFTSDATENNRPFHELVPDYRKNMENAESLTCRIEILSHIRQADGNILMQGKFVTRYQLQREGWEENSGSISMELVENGDSFLVRQLTY